MIVDEYVDVIVNVEVEVAVEIEVVLLRISFQAFRIDALLRTTLSRLVTRDVYDIEMSI